MVGSRWVVSGISLAVTVGAGYAACALIFWIWPQIAANFMNGLFHGLDFRRLQVGPDLFSFGAFAYALVGITAWAFGMGALYGAVSQALRELPRE